MGNYSSAGIVEVSIDGGKWKAYNLHHRHSKGLHYPRTVMLASELSDDDHEARIRIKQNANKATKGHAVRILQFTVNGSF